MGASLAVQWLRFHAAIAGGLGSIPGQGTKITHATLVAKKLKNKIFKNVIWYIVSVVYLILVDYPDVNITYRITFRKYCKFRCH